MVPPAQGDFDMLGGCTRFKQGEHFLAQGRVIGNLVAHRLRRASAGKGPRIDPAVALATVVAGNIPVDHRGIAAKVSCQLRTALALGQPAVNTFTLFGRDSPLCIYHAAKPSLCHVTASVKFTSWGGRPA